MKITISIPEQTAQIICAQAAANGKDVAAFASDLLAEKVMADYPATTADAESYQNPFEPFIGMFASGKTDTSERMHEILYTDDLNPTKGFNPPK